LISLSTARQVRDYKKYIRMKETDISEVSRLKDSLLSVRDALDILGGKWKIPILISLACGKKRFNEIQRDMAVTSKVLSKELKELEMNNLIHRKVTSQIPPVVEYAVTHYCKSLEKVIEGLKEWGDHHRTKIFNRPVKTTTLPKFRDDVRNV
jgi:DNA-binding HxlR family transcriptional regulator